MITIEQFPSESPMRAFIRHPSDVPIELSEAAGGNVPRAKPRVKDVSLGGLSFSCPERLKVGGEVKVRIPIVTPPFEARARVVWCLSQPDRFEAGVEFVDPQDAFAARMVEQICHIEHYRLWVKEVEGRVLDAEEAALEWIGKFAEDFPNLS